SVSYKELLDANKRRLAGEPLPRPVNADAELAGIVEKACAYDAAKRYRHAADLKAALNHWLFTHPEGHEINSQVHPESDHTIPRSDLIDHASTKLTGPFVGMTFIRNGGRKDYTVSASAADDRRLLMNPVTNGHLALTIETFRNLKNTISRSLGQDPGELIVALPDGWALNRKDEVLRIARIAGFASVSQVSQTAAFAAFSMREDSSVRNCLSVSCHSDRVDAALYSISDRRLIKQGFSSMKSRLKGIQITPNLIVEAAGQAVSGTGLSKDQVQALILSGRPDLNELFRGLFPGAKILPAPEHAGGIGTLLAFPCMHLFSGPPVDRLMNTLGFADGTPTGFLPVIKKGTFLPAEGNGTLTLRSDADGCVTVRILEGESTDQRNCEKVSEHIFSDRLIHPYANCRLQLTLRVRSDGSPALTVTDLSTGRTLKPVEMTAAPHFDPGTSSI
ncbi:MAG: hypothetical protein J6D46_08625, partial [Lachnospiraceae bacterium]|nr:hypothetical protein [Lachnospiraceae bacterium]